MNRKAAAAILVVVFCSTGICGVSCAADEKKPANIAMFGGMIEKIDNADPANIKIQVKDDASGNSRTISVAPWTNITKITDVSELKTGDPIRVMVRKTEDKDVAMGILFGKIKNLPPLKPAPVPTPVVKK